MKVLVHPCFRKSDFKINIMLLYQSHEEMKVPYKIKVPNDHFKIKGACVCLGGRGRRDRSCASSERSRRLPLTPESGRV